MNSLEKHGQKLIIGAKELVDFPGLKKKNVLARIDTGARTSSLHCDKVWVERVKNKTVLCATLLKKTKHITHFKKFAKKKVKSSNGISSIRYVVKLEMDLGKKIYLTSFTLNNRDKMNCPVLLGRKFLRARFIVDVSRNYYLGKNSDK